MRASATVELGLGRHVFRHAVGARGHDHDLLPGDTAAELDVGRVEIKPGGGGLGGTAREER